jgi:hypothetical protein
VDRWIGFDVQRIHNGSTYLGCTTNFVPNPGILLNPRSVLSTHFRSYVISRRLSSRSLLPPCTSHSLGVLLVGDVGKSSLRGVESNVTTLTSKSLLTVFIDERVTENEEQNKLQTVRDEERANLEY